MKFIPFGKKYDFTQETLIKNFPDYLIQPVADWIWDELKSANVTLVNDYNREEYLRPNFVNKTQIFLREVVPTYKSDFLNYVFADPERTANILALCLQNYANKYSADDIENILSQGGSYYEVAKTNKEASQYYRGGYDLVERVSPVVKGLSERALNENLTLSDAWGYCYARNPDYEKVVSRCCDFLESYLGKIYFTNDPKPQLKKFVHSFEKTPSILNFKGDTIVDPKSNLTSLLKEASNIRGQHTGGNGRIPTKEEAEFVLHTTIYIWNLHQK